MDANSTVFEGSIFKGIDKIVCKDELRPVMGFAYIDKGHIVATDAHCLVKVDLKFFGLDDEAIKLLEGKCIDRDTLQKLGAMKTSQKYCITEQGFCLLNSKFKASVIYPIELMSENGNYPNYEAVIPKNVAEQSFTSIEPKLLINVDNVFSVALRSEGILKMNFHGEMRAITLASECGQFLGLVMPRKLGF
tara:strand:+ start:6703 stop:7275 length:573 start_codon:yes stop_codon:yes gene_type:complete